jgi:phosphate uptake regulator
MLRELISIMRARDPLHDMADNFAEMLRRSRELTLRAGKVFFAGEATPEERTWIYKQDRKINKLERRIRKQVIAHLAARGRAADIPYCLLLTSLVKDVERIGDYAKNLTEITDFRPGLLPDDDKGRELREIRQGVEEAFDQLAGVFEESDRERAVELIQGGKALAHRCEALIRTVAESDYDARTATAVVLGARFYKRVGGHVLNVLSSVVMPLHKIDYYDEDDIPPELMLEKVV